MLLALLVTALAASSGQAAPPQVSEIALTTGESNWSARYRLSAPVDVLMFARSPDASRVATWTTAPEFEIVATDSGEIVRRRDKRAFSEVTVQTPAAYRPLPKDYAPFSPFGDGSMLVHTGRFFACAQTCDGQSSWPMQLSTQAGQGILLNGKRFAATARWTDNGEGRSVYVGAARPVSTPDLLAVMDKALPAEIREPLNAELPRFMAYFSQRLGRLRERPMLFASYDIRPQGGSGHQGGTLPGQVFVHYYGAKWPREIAKPGFLEGQKWFFAHEAGHIYQRQRFAGDLDGWIHEGAAEAFAAMALRANTPAAAPYVQEKIARADVDCAKSLGADKSVRQALEAGDFQANYSCGLVLNLAIDTAVRRSAPNSDGLFTVWREYIGRTKDKPATEADYLAALAAVGGSRVADAVKAAVRTTKPDLGLTSEVRAD